MTVPIDSQDRQSSIGIIVSQAHHGWIWHTPTSLYVGQADEFIEEYLGINTPRWKRGMTQFTGHTALFTRTNGIVDQNYVKGFVPNCVIIAALDRVLGRFSPLSTLGHWQDDFNLIYDPTSISFEIPANNNQVQQFQQCINNAMNIPFRYKFRSDPDVDVSANNCVTAALLVLSNFILLNMPALRNQYEYILRHNVSSQSYLVTCILNWNLFN
jgi:hypothetical protein